MSISLLQQSRLWAIISVSAGSVLYTLDGGIAVVALPKIAATLGVSSTDAILLISSYNLILAMFLLPLAAISDLIGHGKVFRAGLGVYLIAGAGCYLAGGIWTLIAARCLQALAAASVLSVSLALVRSIYPPNLLGRGMGINTMSASLGAALAPILGGLIVAHLHWSLVFAAGVPLATLALMLSGALPRTEKSPQPFDRYGSVLCAVCIGLTLVGLQSVGAAVPDLVSWALIAFGLALSVHFVRHQLRAPTPVLPVDLLKKPKVSLSVAAAFSAVLSSTMLLLYIPFHLTEMGLNPAQIGASLTPYAVAIMIAAPVSGMLSDRMSPNLLTLTGLACALVACICIAGMNGSPSTVEISWRMALCGAGFGLFFSPNGRMVIVSAPRERAAGASALVATTRMLGQALGATGAGLLMASGPLRLLIPYIAAGLVALGFAAISFRALPALRGQGVTSE